MKRLGFNVPLPRAVTELQVGNETWEETDVETLLEYHNELEKYRDGKDSKYEWDDYEMDGAVHKVIFREAFAFRFASIIEGKD